MAYDRPIVSVLLRRLKERRKYLQVLSGPRQTGKTTIALQLQRRLALPSRYVSADDPANRGAGWLAQQWELARLDAAKSKKKVAVLTVDEVQKVANWSEAVKRLWDEDSRTGTNLKILLLGSSPWLLQRGLTESLAGRFELHYSPHWSFTEMKQAFGWTLDQFLFYGGYPGAAGLVNDYRRWLEYIQHSLIETTLAKDILLLSRIDKPALLRQLFALGCEYSGQILSYQKMLGQLHDAGNTTTLAHYLELLNAAGMLSGLQKFALAGVRRRGSSPKLIARNTGLIHAIVGYPPKEALSDPKHRGRIIESAAGAHLLNTAPSGVNVYYWRERNKEVDFVLTNGNRRVAIEVKSGREKDARAGTEEMLSQFKNVRPLLVGGDGIPVEEFLRRNAVEWF